MKRKPSFPTLNIILLFMEGLQSKRKGILLHGNHKYSRQSPLEN